MPTRQPWLNKFDEWLRKLGLPVQAVATRDGQLIVWLHQNPSEPFVITVRPLASHAPAWATTKRFSLGYGGARVFTTEHQNWMSLLAGMIRRIEARLPSSFDITEGLFDPAVPPEERFLRLFPFCAVERSTIGSDSVVELLVRTTQRCNQHCPFCSAPDHPTPEPRAVLDAIEQAALTFPAVMLSLTGGEPTLCSGFVEQLNAALGFQAIAQVQVQTNAVAFATKLDPGRWPASPKLMFFVSLHATDEAIYDKCTGTVGQLPLALAGIERMLAAGHPVTINCVVNRENLAHLPSYVDSLTRVLPRSDKLDLHFSSLICHERKPDAPAFLVRYPDLARALQQAASQASAHGISVQSLLSSTHASLPSCLLSDSYRRRSPHRATIRNEETGYEDLLRPWVKALRCKDCLRTQYCLGVPSAYAKQFGLDELQPIREA